MAAAAGLGIDNLLVDVSGGEMPAADGSAQALRRSAGVRRASRAAGGATAHRHRRADARRGRQPLDPGAAGGDLPDQLHPGQQPSGDRRSRPPPSTSTEEVFAEEVAPARTYGFLRDVPARCGRTGSRSAARWTTRCGGQAHGAQRQPPLRRRVRPPQGPRPGRRPVPARPARWSAHVVARNAGHALNYELVTIIRKSLAARRAPASAHARDRPDGRASDRRASRALRGASPPSSPATSRSCRPRQRPNAAGAFAPHRPTRGFRLRGRRAAGAVPTARWPPTAGAGPADRVRPSALAREAIMRRSPMRTRRRSLWADRERGPAGPGRGGARAAGGPGVPAPASPPSSGSATCRSS